MARGLRNLRTLAVDALQFGQLFTAPPGIYLRGAKANTVELFMLLGAAAAVAGSLASSRSVLGRLAVPLLLGLYVLCGLWLLRASPAPHIDVFVFQRDASAALLSGQNPYSMTFPNIYGTPHLLWRGDLGRWAVAVWFSLPTPEPLAGPPGTPPR